MVKDIDGYNDYIRLTKGYLNNYKMLKAKLANMTDDLNIKKEELEASEPTAGTVKCGQTHGGTGELTTVEAAAARSEKIKADIVNLKHNHAELSRVLTKVDRALDALPDRDRDLVMRHFVNGEKWSDAALAIGYTDTWTRLRGNKLLASVADAVFSSYVKPEGLKYIFIK